MPTQYAVVSVAEPERHVHLLTTGAEAAVIARQLSQDSVSGARYRVLPVTIDDPAEPDWRQREQARFDGGEYTAVPWASEPWARAEHYAHVAVGAPDMLAFTDGDERGTADRQTRLSPGRYLERFHGGALSSVDIRTWVARWTVAHEGLTLAFATTKAEIERVYRNGPNSCMAHSVRSYSSGIHPTRVYAAGDLAIAYLQAAGEDQISARCVCWPERRVYGRIYDGAEGRLRMLLEAQGYRRGVLAEDWEGARLLLRRVRDQNRIVVPYLDDPNCRLTADLEAGVLRFDATGNIYGRSTDGTSGFIFPGEPMLAPRFVAANAYQLRRIVVTRAPTTNPNPVGTPTHAAWEPFVGSEGMTLYDLWRNRGATAGHLNWRIRLGGELIRIGPRE